MARSPYELHSSCSIFIEIISRENIYKLSADWFRLVAQRKRLWSNSHGAEREMPNLTQHRFALLANLTKVAQKFSHSFAGWLRRWIDEGSKQHNWIDVKKNQINFLCKHRGDCSSRKKNFLYRFFIRFTTSTKARLIQYRKDKYLQFFPHENSAL